MAEAYKRYQKKKIVSSYAEQFGSNMDDKYKYNNILKFKDFEHLNYSEMIKKEFHLYIKKWIEIEQTEQYKELLLEFIRSFTATVRSNRKFVTHNSEEYKNNKRHDLYNVHAIYGQRDNEIRLEPRQVSLEELQAKLKVMRENEKSLEEKPNNEEANNRKKELIAGAKNILKGIYSGATTSVYMENYKGAQPKFHYTFKPDIHSSGVKGVSPDPLVLSRLRQNQDINDNLKDKIRTMLFTGK